LTPGKIKDNYSEFVKLPEDMTEKLKTGSPNFTSGKNFNVVITSQCEPESVYE